MKNELPNMPFNLSIKMKIFLTRAKLWMNMIAFSVLNGIFCKIKLDQVVKEMEFKLVHSVFEP